MFNAQFSIKKPVLLACALVLVSCAFSQPVSKKLQKVYQQFESDSQMKHAISSLYVMDAKTGEVVFDKNSQVGLAPASTQKIITSVTAFEILGKDYRYKTEFGYFEDLLSKKTIFIKSSGDPTLGSWRWDQTNESSLLKRIDEAIEKNNFKFLERVVTSTNGWEHPSIPDGWIWQDIGNYYGTAAHGLNWRENQFDIFLKSGSKIGDPVEITGTTPKVVNVALLSKVTSAAKGTGDNAYIYFPFDISFPDAIIKGTIPINEEKFTISGALPFPEKEIGFAIVKGSKDKFREGWPPSRIVGYADYFPENSKIFHTEFSPSLDSIIYWFNKKSINLYGEALVKTFAYEKQGFGRTDSGVAIVRRFWKDKGLDENELNIYDGSGLSPLNRVTTHAQVEILKYAKTKDWFPYFYNSLPEYNGMTIKSGTISDVKGFAGYHTSKDGKDYIFSFLVNNYNGRTSALVNKMYKVLDVLK